MTQNDPTSKPRVLFICSGNTARSQMAQVLLEHHGGERFEVTSAGLEPGLLNPLTVRVLQEAGFPTAHLNPKSTTPLLKGHFTHVITVCDRAERNCPIFPFAFKREAWPFEDPAAATGSEAERLEVFRRVRNEIDAQVRRWVEEQA
ncbi:arsenate reductase ArsC [Deinococcus sp. Leaf326]|jgi:arsenate reductase|uniref:arsenate reductase ArsC n=1 Tax=Deinococcus sp. Leaf326 TaxID=1736338 RepID=UPI0006F3928F|nr:arsenate reductase ArsC [Deinococcus sp. Leaf326]KQR25692.1 protein tyrosine phosphatase [Deinococcus sp. Leaf326]